MFFDQFDPLITSLILPTNSLALFLVQKLRERQHEFLYDYSFNPDLESVVSHKPVREGWSQKPTSLAYDNDSFILGS